MKKFSRREWIGSASLLATSALLLPRLAKAGRAPRKPNSPRAIVQFFLRGGLDAVLTTDPKRRSEVDARVDVPYEESAITVTGSVRTGPFFKLLEPYVGQMAILNGIQGETVSHNTGEPQAAQMRTTYPMWGGSSVGLTGTVGALRTHDAPLDEAWILSRGFPGFQPAGRALVVETRLPSILDALSRLARDERRRVTLRATVTAELARCGSSNCTPLEVIQALLDRFPRSDLPGPPLVTIPRQARDLPVFPAAAKLWSKIIREAIVLLEHRLTPAIYVWPPYTSFDTHQENLFGQRSSTECFASGLRVFMDEMQRRRMPEGHTLADEIGIVFASELGRFPFLNDLQGKDHLPEFPAVLMGPGIRPGQYGETDRLMVATPISAQTGRPSSSANDFIPTINDLGATLLHWFGIEDTVAAGYPGRRLNFLLKS